MTPIDTLCESAKLRLIANALGLQQCTKTAACIIPIPGMERLIAIGTKVDLARLLELGAGAATTQASTAQAERASSRPLNGIQATHRHDEGAIACCSYCGRYSLDPATLSNRQSVCECGKQHGWSGSFRRPGPDAKWSGKAPAAPVAATSSTDAQAAAEVRSQWISVDERLPENAVDVIILHWPYDNRENTQVANTAHHVDGVFYNEDGDDMHPPSHWMPLNLPALRAGDTGEQA